MDTYLLKTKMFLPSVGPGLVPRPHLDAQIQAGLAAGRKLSLVAAPAGFGKSTLLTAWAGACGAPVAWLSLDEDDNDEQRFWSYVITALQTAAGDGSTVGGRALDLLKLPQAPPVQTVLTTLLNDLGDLPSRIVLVLDDYHAIHTPAIHEALAFVLANQPPQLHLAIATRADPPLPLARLRARRQLTELRTEDLRFTTAEAAALLNKTLRLNLTAGDVAALEARTEGWIVGLQLAAQALQGRPDASAFVAAFTGSHHYILDYLTEEVLHRQTPEIQAFLLQTSILERLSAPLCDAVCNAEDAREILQRLHRADLFILPLDDERRWYRYHHLFADLLQNQLRQTSSAEAIRALHARAGAWHAAQGDAQAAIRHTLQAQQLERAADLVERAFAETVSGGKVSALLRWSDALPEAVVRQRPRLSMVRGWALFLNGRYAQCEQALQDAAALLRDAPGTPETDALRGELSAFQATIATVHQDVPEAMDQAQRALRYLPEEALAARARATRALAVAYGLQSDTDTLIDLCGEAKDLALASGNRFLASEVMSQIAFMRYHKGQLRLSAQVYQEILDLAPQSQSQQLLLRPQPKQQPDAFPPAGLGYIGLALVALERYDLDAMDAYLRHGLTLSRQGGIGYMERTALCIQAIQKQALGDGEGALTAMRAAHQLPWLPGVSEIGVQLVQYRVRLHLLRGEVALAAQWAGGEGFEKPVSLAGLAAVLDEIYHYALARVALAQGDSARALAICDTFIPQAQAAGRMARVIEMTLLKALALEGQGHTEAAQDALARCLALAAPEGYVLLFIEAGKRLPALLHRAAEHSGEHAHARKLLAMLGEPMPAITDTPAPAPEPTAALVDPLTPREREVLRLIGEGLSNQEIADALFVTLNTIKKHSSNLYSKLDVQSRTQAVARAQALGLL